MLFGSGILELALGMILFYFLLSTLCSTLVELLSGLLSWRSQELIKGIQDFLDLPIASGTGDLDESRAGSPGGRAGAMSNNLADRMLGHTMITGMATKPGFFRRTFLGIKREMPTYIPPRTFSLAMMDILSNPHRRADMPMPQDGQQLLTAMRDGMHTVSPALQAALQPLIGGGVETVEQARQNIELWFNAKMDRVSGSYKRRVQWWILVLGLLAAMLLNADSLAVATTLWQTPTLRSAIANQTLTSRLSSDAPSNAASAQTVANLNAVQQVMQNLLIFPLGWGGACARSGAPGTATLAAGSLQPNCTPSDGRGWLFKLVGLLATMLAVSLGASFWFDVLRTVSNLRSSGPAPDEPASTMTRGGKP